MIDLWRPYETKSPATIFSELASDCEKLGISSQDIYGDFTMSTETSWLRRFERELSNDLGKEDCLFLPSGTMAQQIVLRIYAERCQRKSFACHFSSHILLHEQDSYNTLSELDAIVIPPNQNKSTQLPISFETVVQQLSASPTPACLVLECPHREIGGKCTPWEDLVKIFNYCKSHDIALHMDGARLWEAAAAYQRPLPELCAFFGSVYVSFYKGLGGITGAALLGDAELIASARVWLRRFGGNLYTLLPYAVSSWSSYRRHKDSFSDRRARLQHVVRVVSDALSSFRSPQDNVALVRFDPTVPEVSLVHVYIQGCVSVVEAARNAAAEACGVKCFMKLRAGQYGASQESCTEFNMVSCDMLCYITTSLFNVSIFPGPAEWRYPRRGLGAGVDSLCADSARYAGRRAPFITTEEVQLDRNIHLQLLCE